jgi:hypothetical protein
MRFGVVEKPRRSRSPINDRQAVFQGRQEISIGANCDSTYRILNLQGAEQIVGGIEFVYVAIYYIDPTNAIGMVVPNWSLTKQGKVRGYDFIDCLLCCSHML